jgi:Ca2+-binding RTX toxin-like protein
MDPGIRIDYKTPRNVNPEAARQAVLEYLKTNGGNKDDAAKAFGINRPVVYDTLDGEGGSDVILGDDGDDILWGGIGNDLVYGGARADILNFHQLRDISLKLNIFRQID